MKRALKLGAALLLVGLGVIPQATRVAAQPPAEPVDARGGQPVEASAPSEQLEIILAFDASGSMSPVIENVDPSENLIVPALQSTRVGFGELHRMLVVIDWFALVIARKTP